MSESSWASHRDEVFVRQDLRSDVRCDEGPGARAEDVAGRALEVEVESSEQRAARLAHLRSAIESGAYQISAGSVAVKVMERMRLQPAASEGASAERSSAERAQVKRDPAESRAPLPGVSARAAGLRKTAKRSDQ